MTFTEGGDNVFAATYYCIQRGAAKAELLVNLH
jgi:hypothetical protein